MSVDLSKIRPGDEVTVSTTGVVRSVGDGGMVLKLKGGDFETTFTRGEVAALVLVSHTPAPEPLAVGDRVKIKDCGPEYAGTILGLHESLAWLRFLSGGYTTAEVSGLERVDAD